jgi:hypothetical protein
MTLRRNTQMKLKTILVAAVAAAVLPVSALADTATPSDKANGARACTALRTTLGATTFTQTYKTFGACVSAWTRAEHQNRHEAETACKAELPNAKPGELQKCVVAKQKAARAAERQATVSAAKACKTERTQMGATAFATKYGGKANAFGKCVSKRASEQAQNG